MAEDSEIETGDTPETRHAAKRPLWQRILKWIAIAIVGLILLVILIVVGLNTSPGRRFLADRIAGYTTASGMNVQIGRIDGSLYGEMSLKDVRVRDPKGVFLTSPEIDVDWRPFAFIHNHVDIRSLDSHLITLARPPHFIPQPSQPNQPLLPNIDIDVNRLKVDRLVLGAPVTGTKKILAVKGAVHIADRRAQVAAQAVALSAPGVVGGDRFRIKLNAVPANDLLDIDVDVHSPAKGIVAGLTGFKKPFTLAIKGTGDWKAWNGRALATLGGESLANLDLTARNGTFAATGNLHPGLYMQGPVERLTSPQLDVAIRTSLNERRADTRFQLRSSALAVAGNGLIDLANSRFGDFKVHAQLLTPGAIAPNLVGRDVDAKLILDGAFAKPTVNYAITAGMIGFGQTHVEDLAANGIAKVDSNHILLPVNLSARRVTGLNAAAGGLLHNVRINGNIAISRAKILADNLRVRSDKIDATAIIVADLKTGRYTGGLKGRVNNYRIESIGILSLQTDANLVTAPGGGWGIKGHVVAKTSQIFNSGVRNFLGGNAVVSTDVGYDTNGVISFSNLHLSAPQFRITSGNGRYDPKGGILVNANAYSAKYEPLAVRVTGTATAPQVLLRAPHPGVGIGLVNLEARVRGQNGAYAVAASGGTNYGPFNANVVVHTGGVLAVDVERLLFAGVNFHGRVAQTPRGPFAGALAFSGSGLDGNLRLAAQGDVQRADIAARAYNAKIPGNMGITMGRAIVSATAILYPNAPSLTADAQVADLRYGPTTIAKARAKVDCRGGHGIAQLVASGSNGVPFQIAANARLAPNDYLVALKGVADGVAFRTDNPAHITAANGRYMLAPTRIDFDKGSIRLAGRFGDGMAVQARLDRLDLSIINAFVPNILVGGTATGSLDFTQPAGGGFPRADARINIANFTRSTTARVSEPVDIVFRGQLLPDGGDARALIKRGDLVVGRMIATLTPLPPGAGPWSTRLLGAPLSGGIRYNGSSSVLFSLAGLADQQLSGPIAVAANFSGRVREPQLNGLIRADNLTYENETYGTRFTNMAIRGQFSNDRFVLNSLTAKAGDGTIKAQGSIGLAADAGFPINVVADFNNAQLARSDSLSATTTGQLRIVNDSKTGASISGTLTIPQARYEIIRQSRADVPQLQGVRRKGQPLDSEEKQQKSGAPGLFKLDLTIKADNQLYVSGMGLESEWSANLHVGGTSANPRVTGEAQIVRGTYSFAGKRFTIDRGIVRFEGGAIADPTLNISASTTTNGITAIINITGTGQKPQVSFTSDPVLPQDEVLSRLLFGASPENLSALQALQLASALNSLRGSGGGLNPLGKLRSATGIDRLQILGADQNTGRGTAIAAGKYLTDNIYLQIITDARGFTATQLEVSLTKALSVLSQAGSFGGSSVDVQYKKDY